MEHGADQCQVPYCQVWLIVSSPRPTYSTPSVEYARDIVHRFTSDPLSASVTLLSHNNHYVARTQILQKDGSWVPLLETVESAQIEIVPAALTR